MKTLLLIRHAKSSWDEADLSDVERPLAPRGVRAACKMGKRLAKRQANIDLLLSSSAVRAQATANLIARQLGYKARKIVVDERLYATSARALLTIIHALDDNLRRVIVVGHNPELSTLAQRLSKLDVTLPTCAIATLKFDTKSWAVVDRAPMVSVSIDYPRRRSARTKV